MGRKGRRILIRRFFFLKRVFFSIRRCKTSEKELRYRRRNQEGSADTSMKPLRTIPKLVESSTFMNSGTSMHEAAWFATVTLMIVLFGLSVLYSTSYGNAGSGYFLKQLMWMGVGLCGCATVLCLGYKRVSDWSPWLMGLIAVALLSTFLFDPINGARRWIKLGSFSVQPSEYAKLILVLFLAKFLSERTRLIETHPFRVFLLGGLFSFLVVGLVLAGHDLGTTVLLSAVFLSMMFAAGVRLIYILLPVVIMLPAGFFLIKAFSPVRWARITTFTNPELTQSAEGYQLWLSQLALGSGGWTGVGFTASRMKQKYLPEAHTDFILSVAGEELGYLMMCGVVLAYVVLMLLALIIACKARTRQGMLICFGVLTFITFQAIVNMGVIAGGLPTKGMPAPFISYGGSSLVTCLTAVGFICSVALDSSYPDYQLGWYQYIRSKYRHVLSLIYTSK